MINKLKLILLITVIALFLAGCSTPNSNPTQNPDSAKISIVTTLFPHYDFARQVAGEKADITLLLPPGTESHAYEPSPADIITINQSDLFIYTGENMEVWADSIIKGVWNDSVTILDVSQGVQLKGPEDNHEGHGHAEDEDVHIHEFDPHIWTSPVIAKAMVQSIADSLSAIDPDNADYYSGNAEAYLKELNKLDGTFRQVIAEGARDEIFFGGRFALLYFVEEYGLSYEAAFDSCSAETEPSAAVIAHMIDEINENNVKYLFHEELTDPRVARSIASETGSELLLFHSVHNLSKDEFESGETYLSLMYMNAENLAKGLE